MGIDVERQKKAKEYARIRHRLLALELVVGALAMLAVLATGLSAQLRDLVIEFAPDPLPGTLIYFIVGALAYGLLFFPLTYYSGYVLPHRFGLSVQTFSGWLWDVVKAGGVAMLLGGLVIEVIYFLLRSIPDWWWLVAAGFMLVFTVVLAQLAPVVIFPLFFKVKALEDPELVDRLMQLTERARTRVNGVYTMALSEKTTAANAAFMGLGRTKRIVLGDTLYQNYTADEIETILAHELGHQVHNDIAWGIAVQSLLILLGFYAANWVLQLGVVWFGLEGVADLAGMPLLALALGVFGLVTMPLDNAYLRWREARADAYALELTRRPDAFVSAMEKLADQNLAEVEPEPWVEWLLYDHPSIGKRIAMARAYQAGGGT